MVLLFDRRKREGHVSFQKFEFDLNDDLEEVTADQFDKLKNKLNMVNLYKHSQCLKDTKTSLSNFKKFSTSIPFLCSSYWTVYFPT